MRILRGSVLCAFSALYLATAAPAQGSLEVPYASLEPGTEITISYSNPEQAGGVIAVEIGDGVEESDYILIELDEDGEGYGSWEVSEEWDLVHFNAPDADLVSRWILLN